MRAIDLADNVDPTPAKRVFTLDRAAPLTSIVKRPPAKSKRRKVTFKFSADGSATFACKLDSKPFKPCSSPFSARVKVRKHLFQVRATDVAGNVDATPAKARFRRLP